MISLNSPNINFEVFFCTCVDNKLEPGKSDLLACLPQITQLTKDYEALANPNELYTLNILDPSEINDRLKKMLANLYSERMAARTSPGRRLFDLLLSEAKGKCPYCQHGFPRTLDHYLPKSKSNGYPELSLFALNLIPCCMHCNSNKGSRIPQNIEEQYIHPYLEDISSIQWLTSKIEFSSNQPTLIYYINDDIDNTTLKNRLTLQFEDLKLGLLYSIQAGSEISAIESLLRGLIDEGTSTDVKNYLIGQADTRKRKNKNSWQAVLYDRLSKNERFCSMDWIL